MQYLLTLPKSKPPHQVANNSRSCATFLHQKATLTSPSHSRQHIDLMGCLPSSLAVTAADLLRLKRKQGTASSPL
jgi:hypothetical protein